ncbi:hypothetical protein DYI37_03955 [Fulvimarina endophytica]|uniref:Peptidoglycan binding-like domain-containing protein n=1 Tax=Fulvimarina endophytica TaxID=2293836 RepID=A0A371X726_9HYPH|nr:peptidoglycan-binding protein [Fulvimarina endophytica]RFC65028.1 hypothetical protein DYI37_03955 [Fulvimarina endophytica]
MSFEEWLQSRLTAHGFPCGAIDGVIGPVTIAALKAFERSRGFPVDGTADERVVAALRLTASALPAGVIRPADLPEAEIQKIKLVPQTWPRQADVPAFFGAIGTRQTLIEIPFDMVLAYDRGVRARRMSLHEKVAPSALRVLERVAQLYSAKERAELGLNLFAGSLNVRRMRGGSAYSMHSWGIAIDFDNARNPLNAGRPEARLSHADALPFWQAWEAEGWLSLGRARNFDWMHVQAARL